MKSPVEKAVADLAWQWQDVSAASQSTVFIWRVPNNGESLLTAFIAQQQHAEGRNLPDLFVQYTMPFETGYGYSETLGREFVEQYEQTEEASVEWNPEPFLPSYTPGTLQHLLASFAAAHPQALDRLIMVLKPEQVSDLSAMMRWLSQWLALPTTKARVLLIDTVEQPLWQPLMQLASPRVQLITSERLDTFAAMHQTAQQQHDPDPQRQVFRRYLTDLMVLMEKGSAQQVADRGQLALAVAARNGWSDQQAIVQHMIAGSWLKSRDPMKAIKHYREAGVCSAAITDPKLKGTLQIQSLFGEAGAWFANKEYLNAAKVYRLAAEASHRLPHPLFEIEGYRMCGFSLHLAESPQAAIVDYHRAIEAAQPLSVTERQQTTLPLVFQDLLKINESSRTLQLEKVAQEWHAQKALFIAQAESSLPAQPTVAAVKQSERQLQRQLEQAFFALRKQREMLIVKGHPTFQRTVHLARQLLHPHWNGLPEIAHPFDAPPGEWQELPAWQEQSEGTSQS